MEPTINTNQGGSNNIFSNAPGTHYPSTTAMGNTNAEQHFPIDGTSPISEFENPEIIRPQPVVDVNSEVPNTNMQADAHNLDTDTLAYAGDTTLIVEEIDRFPYLFEFLGFDF